MNNPDKQKRDIKYINKDFGQLRTALINYAKNYYPNTYSDFNESSPGMMFIEMASYVGDVLSLYGDVQLQESFLYTVDEKINLYNLAQSMGYKAKTIVPAQVDLDLMQLVPAIGEGNNAGPDYTYALVVNKDMQVKTSDDIYFRTVDAVDFRHSSSYDPTTVSVYSVTNDGSIEYFLLKKKVKAVSGQLLSSTYTFGNAKIYDKIVVRQDNVSEIVNITDSDGNTWYEVPYLAQDLVSIPIKNTPFNDPVLSQFRSSVPYLLSFKQTEYRFVTRVRKDDLLEIQFGSGLSREADEEIVPNPYNVAIGLDYFRRSTDVSIDPMNFLYTKTYGQVPNSTTLTVQYAVANGLLDNVNANTLTTITNSSIINPLEIVDSVTLNFVKASLTVNNPLPAYGGANKKELEVVRQEAMANFAAQNRAVTKEDYILRCYTMPSKYGAIAKAYIEQDHQISSFDFQDRMPNPMALNLYILTYDASKNLVAANEAIKENLRTYLRQYRLMTDAINIKDPYIVNFGIDYEIITRPNYNSNEVLTKCHQVLMKLFEPDNMQINQPIFLGRLYTELDRVEGVQTVESVKIINLYNSDEGFSGNVYDIDGATRRNVIYPSLDAMIFELRNPKANIKGRVVDL